jgi:hypothetical protein
MHFQSIVPLGMELCIQFQLLSKIETIQVSSGYFLYKSAISLY